MTEVETRMKELGDRRLALVSGYALRPLTPRGQRSQWLQKSLSRSWDVELTALPASAAAGNAAPRSGRVAWRRAASDAVRTTLLDKWEPWSLRRLGRWQPQVDAGVLIAAPWSPVAYAARRLHRGGVPYVVDVGDQWALTSRETDIRLLAEYRCRRAERAIWGGAAGAVLTTRQQAEVVSGFFPALPILVRPNGYEPVDFAIDAPPGDASARDPKQLRLVHYGILTFIRVDIIAMLERLVASGRWKSISFTQYGDDHAEMLARVPASVEVELRPAQPWPEVLASASQYDLALVAGNWMSGQMPSKTVQYMTLPIPRLALCERASNDPLAEYVDGRPGWLALGKDEPMAAERVWEHLERDWTADELAPPPEEAWPRVADRIAKFVDQCVGGASALAAQPTQVELG